MSTDMRWCLGCSQASLVEFFLRKVLSHSIWVER
jgi:hypothetical protein